MHTNYFLKLNSFRTIQERDHTLYMGAHNIIPGNILVTPGDYDSFDNKFFGAE